MLISREKTNRRIFLKKSLTFFTSIIGVGMFGYLYARYIEPKRLTTIEHTLSSEQIPISFDGVKVIQFSDTHLGHNYTLLQLQKLVDQINEYKPDIILFSGDLMDAPNKYKHQEKIAPILKELSAPMGKYAIYGNHDHGGYGSNDYKKIMVSSDFRLLVNESQQITNEFNESITIAGIDDLILGKPNPEKTFSKIGKNEYTIFMAHEPDIVDELTDFPISIQLSGHSHGGQVQIPFIGPLVTPPGANRYHEGFYHVKDVTTLYVNRGIGTTRMPFRFLSLPELTIFTLKSTKT